MLINFLFAIFFISMMGILVISLDVSTSMISKLIRFILKWTYRSKILTAYILKAYVHYRRAINKPLINNNY